MAKPQRPILVPNFFDELNVRFSGEAEVTGDVFNDHTGLGIDYLINLGVPHGQGVRVLQHDGEPNAYTEIADLATLTTGANSLAGTD